MKRFSTTAIALLSLVGTLAGACGDDGGGSTPDARKSPDAMVGTPDAETSAADADTTDADMTADADTTDADTTPDADTTDADTTPATTSIWYHGDPLENNRYQLVRFTHGATLPLAMPDLALPSVAGELPRSNGDGSLAAWDVNAANTKIAFAADVDVTGRSDLYVADFDGTNIVHVAAMGAAADVTRVRFSPDGTRIAFIADDTLDNKTDLYVVSSAAVLGTPVRISPDRPADPAASDDTLNFIWSRDSTTVIMTGEYTANDVRELWSTDVTAVTIAPVALVDSARVLATSNGSNGAVNPVYQTSAGKILFRARIDADNAYKFYEVDADGNNLRVLPNSMMMRANNSIADIGSAGISPDGSTLAFSADPLVSTAYEIYTMPVDGSAAPTRLTSGTKVDGQNPKFGKPLQWSPDGTKIAFVGDYGTPGNKDEPYVIAAAGGPEIRLAQVAGSANEDAEEISWTMDGSALYFTADHGAPNDTELWLLSDPTATDQTPVLVLGVVSGGDVRGLRATAN